MLVFILKRLAIAVPTLLILIVASFVLMYAAPGGPFTSERELPAQVLANLNAKYGLDQPLWRQILNYLWGIVAHFDFGPSFVYKDRTVNDVIAQIEPVDSQERFEGLGVRVIRERGRFVGPGEVEAGGR